MHWCLLEGLVEYKHYRRDVERDPVCQILLLSMTLLQSDRIKHFCGLITCLRTKLCAK